MIVPDNGRGHINCVRGPLGIGRRTIMHRREFARTLAGAALGSTMLSAAPPIAAREPEPPVPFKFSVMLWTVYRDLPFEQRLEKVAEAGYHAVELVDEYEPWSEEDFRKANARKRSLRITFDATAGVRGAADPRAREAFLSDLTQLLPVADKLECSAIIVLSGDKVDGFSHESQHQNCVETLKRAADIAAKQKVTLLLENIDPEENPQYYLTSVAEGFEIVREVGHPHLKFLYDFYHEQIAEGNLIEKLEKNIDHLGLVHIADVPGRHEPGTGEINYANIYRKLAQLKYDRYLAMEFLPSGDPVATLRAARELAASSASN
jgi:hydroxypyruvate isomerase